MVYLKNRRDTFQINQVQESGRAIDIQIRWTIKARQHFVGNVCRDNMTIPIGVVSSGME